LSWDDVVPDGDDDGGAPWPAPATGGGGGGGPLRPEEARSSPAEWDYMKHAITWGWLWCVVPTAKKQAQLRPHLVLREIKRCDGEKIELSK
jgi:hypothetical protein